MDGPSSPLFTVPEQSLATNGGKPARYRVTDTNLRRTCAGFGTA
ncbi:hypothetical protein [Actinoplanes couchii]|uniref:Uncharacterized protein n=1 Tax=Actinoplanes couchii TaxID=403638 RepID=A0ABQ3XGM4_9ACTN|nr:hypothetical protein [Actinoplanes couchii]MDR6321138.1 hypothetical protein [Actinoplanes couchii]GID57651.1 hypothetical protein Aco03nite_060550 [Actinoplanes couchii]